MHDAPQLSFLDQGPMSRQMNDRLPEAQQLQLQMVRERDSGSKDTIRHSLFRPSVKGAHDLSSWPQH